VEVGQGRVVLDLRFELGEKAERGIAVVGSAGGF
jgi:hypothetical protein